jgi:hypothetical protein
LRTERDRPYRAYCRVAAAAFALVVVYTLLVKLLEGELGGDWMHTALHVATGAAAVYAGWFAARAVAAKAFMLGLGAAYGALGIGGWFEDGLLMDSAFRIPLGPQDNLFHLLLVAGAAVTAIAGRRSPPAPGAGAHSE